MARIKEFVQLDEIHNIQHEINDLNRELMTALNQTSDIKELISEKNRIIDRAGKISTMILP